MHSYIVRPTLEAAAGFSSATVGHFLSACPTPSPDS